MPDPTPERWVYAGKRIINAGSALADAWYDPANDVIYFFKMPAYRIGEYYLIKVIRDEGKVQVMGKPDWVDFTYEDREKAKGWVALDDVNRSTWARLRKEKKAPDQLDQALVKLRPMFAACRTHADRTALISSVIDRLYRM